MMAGYHIYSLDWQRFQQFTERPSQSQLMAFSELISDGLDEQDGDFEEGDFLQDWPSEPEELSKLIAPRLKGGDWYGDLSNAGKTLWERGVTNFCDDARPKDVNFRVESDGIYWDVIELARRHHGIPLNHVTESVLSHFGTRPYRYRPVAGRALTWDDWTPNHSMHTPEEVLRLLEDLEAAGPSILASTDEGAKLDFEKELMPSIRKVAESGRLLYIGVDT